MNTGITGARQLPLPDFDSICFEKIKFNSRVAILPVVKKLLCNIDFHPVPYKQLPEREWGTGEHF